MLTTAACSLGLALVHRRRRRTPRATNHAAIPLVDVAASYREVRARGDAAIRRVLDSGYFIGGPEVAAFEREWAAYVGSAECVSCNSGTDALYLALKHLGVREGDEVVTQANTFIGTVLGASRLGAKIVVVDIDPQTAQMDVSALAHAITPRTAAIVPVHLHGQCADVEEVLRLADAETKRRGSGGRAVVVVEDDNSDPLVRQLRTESFGICWMDMSEKRWSSPPSPF